MKISALLACSIPLLACQQQNLAGASPTARDLFDHGSLSGSGEPGGTVGRGDVCEADVAIPLPPSSSAVDFIPDSADSAFSVAATLEILQVPQNGSLNVAFEISRSEGFVEPVRVTVDGLPVGVTATEVILDSSELVGTISITALRTVAVPEPITLRLVGRSESAAHSAPIKLTVRGPAASIDTSFGTNGYVYSMLYIFDLEHQADGKLVFTGWAEDQALTVCRLEADGAPDLSFGLSDGCARVPFAEGAIGRKLVIRGGEILVTGTLLSSGIFVARFLSNGVLDATFGGTGWVETSYVGTDAFPTDMVVSDDKIVIVGGTADEKAFLTRLNGDGTLDDDFAINGRVFFADQRAYHLVRLRDCRWVASTGNALHAFESNGLPAHAFGTSGGALDFPSLAARALARAPNGDLLTAWDDMTVVRVSSAGVITATYQALDPGNDSKGVAQQAYAGDIVLLPDGTIVLGGSVSAGDGRMGIGRRSPTGVADDSFGIGGASAYSGGSLGQDLEVSRDGRYLLAGTRELNEGVILRVWN